MLQRVVTKPDPYEPFLISQGVRVGELVFISGQAGYDDGGEIVKVGFRAQGDQAFLNLQRVLTAGGSSLSHVVKVTLYPTDMTHFVDVVELRLKFFSLAYPADSIGEVKALYTPLP